MSPVDGVGVLYQEDWVNLWEIIWLQANLRACDNHSWSVKYTPDSITNEHIYHHAHIKVLVVARGDHFNRFLNQQVCPVKFQCLYLPLLLMVSYHVHLNYQEFSNTPCGLSNKILPTSDQGRGNNGWKADIWKPTATPLVWYFQNWFRCSFLELLMIGNFFWSPCVSVSNNAKCQWMDFLFRTCFKVGGKGDGASSKMIVD